MNGNRVERGAGPARTEWAARPWLTGALGALAGLLIFLLMDGGGEDVPWRVAASAFVFFGAVALALTLEEDRPGESAIFAGVLGLVLAGIAWHALLAGERLAGREYAFAAGVLASLLAVPLFEAGFHRRRFATSCARAHAHAWDDAVSGAGAVLFTGISWLLLVLVDLLLGLVGIDIVDELIDARWFALVWSGASFGAALGVLRNHPDVIGSLRRVVMLVLALLAVPFAAALLVFLSALVLTGGQALWNASDSATPILLACAAGSFLLASSIVRDDEAGRSHSRVMLAAAVVLALAILPLSAFAALSMGLRIDQHGLSPERLWALVAIGVATAFGLAYWVALARNWRTGEWAISLRETNLRLAVAVCVTALLLALPILDFGALSARNQVARLESGKVSAAQFDYAALRWDFGEAGREALARLADGEGEVAQLARAAERQASRPASIPPDRDWAADKLRVEPDDPALRRLVIDHLRANPWRCKSFCVALRLDEPGPGLVRIVLVEGSGHEVIRLPVAEGGEFSRARREIERKSVDRHSRVEIRELTRRFVTVDGEPIGEPLD